LVIQLKTTVLVAFGAVALGVSAFAALPPFASRDMEFVKAGPAVLGYVSYMGLYGPMPYQVDDFWIDRFEITNANTMNLLRQRATPRQHFLTKMT